MNRFLAGVVVGAAMLIVPTAAQAVTTIGSTEDGGFTQAGAPYTVVHTVSPSGAPSYAVPAGNWVLTSASARLSASGADPDAAAIVARPTQTAGNYEIRRRLPFALEDSQAQTLETATPSSGVPVQGGDLLGLEWDTTTVASLRNIAGAKIAYDTSTFAEGSTATLPTQDQNFAYAVAATLEPDADADGAGDETQDACPADADRAAGPCRTDLAAAISLNPGGGVVGTDLTATATVTNTGAFAAPARGTFIWGQSVVPLSSSDPACPVNTAAITCDFGTLAAGASRTVVVTYDTRYPDAGAIGFSVQAPAGDTNNANDTASAPYGISAAPVLAPTPPATKRCSLPKAKRKTLVKGSLKAARKAVAKAGCKVRVTKPKKVRKGRVLKVAAVTVKNGTATVQLKAYKRKARKKR